VNVIVNIIQADSSVIGLVFFTDTAGFLLRVEHNYSVLRIKGFK